MPRPRRPRSGRRGGGPVDARPIDGTPFDGTPFDGTPFDGGPSGDRGHGRRERDSTDRRDEEGDEMAGETRTAGGTPCHGRPSGPRNPIVYGPGRIVKQRPTRRRGPERRPGVADHLSGRGTMEAGDRRIRIDRIHDGEGTQVDQIHAIARAEHDGAAATVATAMPLP